LQFQQIFIKRIKRSFFERDLPICPSPVSSQITCFQTIFCRKESFKQVLKKFSFFSLLGTLKKSHPIIKLCYKISLLISFMNSFFPFFYSILVFIFLACLSVLVLFQLQNKFRSGSFLEISNVTTQRMLNIVNLSMKKQLSFKALGLLCFYFKESFSLRKTSFSLFFYFMALFFKDKGLSRSVDYCLDSALFFCSFFKEILFLIES
jgi:hypothetical protein